MSPFFSTVECRDGRAALVRYEDGNYGLVTYNQDEAQAVTLTAEQVRQMLAPYPELRTESPTKEASRRMCTCTGSCRGKDGLGPAWTCALGMS